jgi:hypothetical protein
VEHEEEEEERLMAAVGSAMTLLQLQQFVRDQTQTTIGELPDAIVNTWLQEAFNRTVAYENQWPWFEKTWIVTALPADETHTGYTIEVPGDCNVSAITGFVSRDKGWRLPLTPHVTAQDNWGPYPSTTGGYVAVSVWAGEFILWPNAPTTEALDFSLVGFRYPVDWISEGPAAYPDIDPRLHSALTHFAISLAYAQQEDETLESTYMQRWQTDVNTVRGAVMEPSQDRPLVFGPQRTTPIGNMGYRQRESVIINAPGTPGPPGADAFAYFVYTKSVDHLGIGEVYEQIATLNATLPIDGTYMIGAALTWTLDSVASSAQWRWRINGGNWNENIRQPKDASEKYSDYYAYPDEYTAGALLIEVEAQKTGPSGIFDVQFLDIFAEYKANTA